MDSLPLPIRTLLREHWWRIVVTLVLLSLVVHSSLALYNFQVSIHERHTRSLNPTRPTWACEQIYLEQAEAFLRGRFDIDVRDIDAVVHHGRYYVPYPPMPAIFYMPLVAVYGVHFCVAYYMCAVLTAVNAVNLDAIGRRLGLAVGDRWWLAMAFFFGTGYWFCLAYSFSGAYNSHIFVCTFLLAAIRESLGRARGWVLGLLLGALVTTRPMTIFVTPFLLTAVWCRYYPEKRWRGVLLQWLVGALTVAPIFAGAAYFNYARFGSPFELGYSLTGYNHRQGFMSPVYLPRHLYYLLVHGFTLGFTSRDGVSGLRPDLWGTSLTIASPYLLLAFAAKFRAPLVAAGWASVVPAALAICMCAYGGFLQLNCQRYAFDYLPLLFFLAMLGYRSQLRSGAMLCWKLLIVWSVMLNVIVVGLLPELDRWLKAYVNFMRG